MDSTAQQLPDPEIEPTITVPQAGKAMNLSRGAAYNAAAADEIPTLRIGRRLLVPTARLREMFGLS